MFYIFDCTIAVHTVKGKFVLVYTTSVLFIFWKKIMYNYTSNINNSPTGFENG